MRVERVDVIRAGAALRLSLEGGATRVVRRKDLTGVLGEVRAGEQRFAEAHVAGDAIDIVHADGSSEAVPLALLLDVPAPERVDLVIDRCGLLLTCDGDGTGADALGAIPDAMICIAGGAIAWAGPRGERPAGLSLDRAHHLDARGRLVTPGLVDPHAHPMFAGNRADEFALRAAGRSYLDIQQAGGGIAATVEPTRAASFDEHVRLTSARMARALAHGTTTCEAKSGYDLTVDGELRLLEVAWTVDALQPVDLSPTLLGAHVLPPERAGDRDGFVADVAERMVPRAAERGLAQSVDVYCDANAFTLEETARILRAARAAGLPIRAHAGQFADLGAPELVAELGGLSVDHMEQVSDAGIAAIADAGVTAIMLPGACVQLRLAPPPVERLRAAGVRLAIGTDLNPGSSLSESLPLQMWLATTHLGMTVEEAWLGVTRDAARALGRHDIGRIVAGARADLVVWDAERPGEIPYHYGVNLAHHVIKGGRPHRARPPENVARM